MCNKCILCNTIHGEIYQRFDRFFQTKNIDEILIREFIRFVEFELNQENWNEVYCLISNMDDSMASKNNLTINEIIFHKIIHKIKLQLVQNPKLGFFEELKESLINDFSKLNKYMPFHGNKVKRIKNYDPNKEFTYLIKVLEHIKDTPDLETPLKNYVVFRVMGFFEVTMHVTLANEINKLSPDILYQIKGSSIELRTEDALDFDDITIGNLAILGLDNSTRNIDDLIGKILKFLNKNISNGRATSGSSSFFNYFKSTVSIDNEKLNEYFLKKYSGNWWKFIKNLNQERNKMTHQLGNVSYSKDDLDRILNLMFIFLYYVPHLLQFVIQYCSENYDKKKHQEFHAEISDLFKNHECSLPSYDLCIDHFQQVFGLDTLENGTVKVFDKTKGFGFIRRDSEDDLFFHVSDVQGIVDAGDKIEFNLGMGKNGKPKAVNVKKI